MICSNKDIENKGPVIESLDENNAIYVQESEFKLLTKGWAHLTGEEQNRSDQTIHQSNVDQTNNQSNMDPAYTLEYSRRQPAWHVFVLSVFTLGIYNVYWFYKSLRFLQKEAGSEGGSAANLAASKDGQKYSCQKHPVFSTVIFLIPIANLIIGMYFFALVGELLPQKDSLWHKNNLLCAFLLALCFGALCLLWRLNEPYNLFYLLSGLPLALVQSGLNKHWQVVEQDNLVVRAAFNPIELVIIFFGAGFLGLCAVGPSLIPTIKP